MKVYYARPISLYGTKQEERDIKLINSIRDGNAWWQLINPNKEELQERYKTDKIPF